MRWDGLFADLEAQADAFAQAERAAEVEDRTRREVSQLAVFDRLRVAVGTQLQVRVVGPHAAAGTVMRVGPDWVLLAEGGGREVLVALGALSGIRGLARFTAVPDAAGVVASRLDLRHVLRGIARDRSTVRLHLTDGATLDATIDRVGRDFADVATHAAGEVRRRSEVRDVELVPLVALALVRRVL